MLNRILFTMDTAAEVLLIIVSSVLSVFLIVAVVAFIYVISVLRQVKRITQRAENVADSVESAAHVFERTASPLAVLKIIADIVDKATKMRKRKG